MTTQLLNIFAPESTPARAIVDLSMLVLSITAVIFVVVASLLVYAIVKFRATPANADREPAQVYGSTQIELAWTIVPILIVLVLFAATARVIHAIQDAPQPPTAVEVTVIGHQFWWEYRYPALGVVTANELHIPVSDPSRPRPTFLTLLSADTDHSFWIPQLAGKTDLIPNRVNRDVDRSASTGHLSRPVRAVLRDAARQDAAARVGRHARATSTRGFARSSSPRSRTSRRRAGRRVFETTACINCHTVRGTVANGRFGPDLTHLMSRATIASGAAENTPENLRLWIENPDAIKPGSLMPAMKLTDAELDALVRYMQSLR